ncbi:MAG: alpha/beta fold hydrolase, partial [Cyanobacteria bacterium J06628_3]
MTITSQSTTFEKLFWTWKDYKIQYTVVGTGQPLVLIHGFGASIGHWKKNIPVLAEAGYQVFALDLLGFGGSDKAPIEYSVDLWVELIKDFCSEHIKQPAVFIGNSV